ncbi:MAG: lasso RiPP family leader peptide-containing protein [Actinomycetota bacterium]
MSNHYQAPRIRVLGSVADLTLNHRGKNGRECDASDFSNISPHGKDIGTDCPTPGGP